MIEVGKILGAHGIRGELKVLSLSSNPQRFKKGAKLFFAATGEEMEIKSCRKQGELLLLGFRGIDDRNSAEALKGEILQIAEEQLLPLGENEFYFFQLLGLEVVDEEGILLGTISDLVVNAGNDVYRVELGAGDYLLLPALKQVVKKVDLERKKMTVRLLPGLLEACKYHED